MVTGQIGPLPTDIGIIPLGGPYYIKLTDLLFMMAGIAALLVGLHKKLTWLVVLGIGLVLVGILGVAIGWD